MKKTSFSWINEIVKRRSSLFAEALLLLITILSLGGNSKMFPASFIIFAIHTIYLICVIIKDKKTLKAPTSSLLSGMTLELVSKLNKPVIMVDKEGTITWYNEMFISAIGVQGALYGKSISEQLGHSINPARLFRDSFSRLELSVGKAQFDISCYVTSSGGKAFCILVFDDITSLNIAKSQLDNKNVLLAFIIIDNFSEAMQFIQDKSRTASALIGGVLDEWASSLSGVIKEYDRDKYLLMFEKSHLDSLRESKFEILDKLRSISIDDEEMEFTASIGVACIDGTLAEKEAASRACVDLALQRGGDQAVIKIDEGTMEFYGGKRKSVQKKTKVRSRVVAKELSYHINQCSNVIVMGHKYADHDSIASCVAVARIAKKLGKQANIVINIHDVNLKAIFNSLRGSKEYSDLFIDRECAQELMRAETLVVVCDVNNVKLFELPEIYEAAATVIIIDHHRKTADFDNEPALSYIEPAASSVSELMSELLEQILAPGELPTAEANLILSGIILDTKQFTKNTGVRTFGAAQYLRSEGASPYETQKLFRTSATDFMRESQFENNIHIYRDCIAISTYEGKATNADRIAAAKAADRLLSVEGVSSSFVLCTIGDEISISARSDGSDGSLNVQLILEALGGGGHFDAAGAQVKGMDMREVLEKLKVSIDELLG